MLRTEIIIWDLPVSGRDVLLLHLKGDDSQLLSADAVLPSLLCNAF